MFVALNQTLRLYLNLSIDWSIITILEDLFLKLCNLECVCIPVVTLDAGWLSVNISLF